VYISWYVYEGLEERSSEDTAATEKERKLKKKVLCNQHITEKKKREFF